jgi:energy-coupling factor transport system ATP-binding protein
MGTPFEHAALKDVSFCVERGEFIGIIGHTGSGKSTLIQHFNGLLKPTSGQILLDGTDIWKDKASTRASRFKVGLVFQYPEYQLFEETVYKDIAYGPKNMGLSDDEIDKRVRDAISFCGLEEELLEKSPFELSGGQKRRVAIAGVMAMDPDVLILDEPAAGLDPMGRADILGGVWSYQRRRKNTVIIVSHSMEDMAQYADEIVVMSKAKLFLNGKSKEVFRQSEALKSVGLDVPQITRFMQALNHPGVDVRTDIFTVEQAREELLRVLGGGRRA